MQPIIVAILTLALTLGGAAWAQPADRERAQKAQEANADLDALSQEMVRALAHPGFRGLVKAEIAKSKNREQLLELGPLLEKTSKGGGPAAPPGLAKLREAENKAAGHARAKEAGKPEGLDLYLPVPEHRSAWKGGADLLVTFAPVGDAPVRELVAYSVKTGKAVKLAADQAPDTPVLVIAPEEHDSHEAVTAPADPGPVPPERPEPHAEGREPPERPVPQEPGNSVVGLHYLKIYKTAEEWWEGEPEIQLFFGQRKGNSCEAKYEDLDYVDKAGIWYDTWTTAWSSTQRARFYFDGDYSDKMRIEIWEKDFALFGDIATRLYEIYPGITCEWYYMSNYDRIDYTNQYRSNFDYSYDYYHYIGDAYLVWRKAH